MTSHRHTSLWVAGTRRVSVLQVPHVRVQKEHRIGRIGRIAGAAHHGRHVEEVPRVDDAIVRRTGARVAGARRAGGARPAVRVERLRRVRAASRRADLAKTRNKITLYSLDSEFTE